MIVLTYIAKTTLGLFLFFLLYKLIFKKEGILKFNRYYLLFSLFASFLLPFLTLELPISPEFTTRLFQAEDNAANVQVLNVVPEYAMPGNAISEQPSSDQLIVDQNDIYQSVVPQIQVENHKPNTTNVFTIISWSFIGLYLLGVLVLHFSFLYQLKQTLYLIRHSEGERLSKAKLIKHSLEIMPFSIFNYIIINRNHYCEKEFEYVLLHEMEHINQKHSFDILLIELLKIIFWINPVIWLYEREIKQNHEFLADRGVLEQGIQKCDYQLILLNSSLGVPKYNIVNNFNQSHIKKRIMMMTSNNSNKLPGWKLLLIIPVIFTIVIACANPSGSKAAEKTAVVADEITDYTKYIQLNTPYDWVSYANGDFFCEGTYTIHKIDSNGLFEGEQINNTLHGKLPITGKLTKDMLEFYTGNPWNEIWAISKTENGKLEGKIFADYSKATKNRITFYLAKHIAYEELLPASMNHPGMEISKNLHLRLFEKYFYEIFKEDGSSHFTGWFMITNYDEKTKDISGHQCVLWTNAMGAFSGKLNDDSITINIGEPWNQIWNAKPVGNELKGTVYMDPRIVGFSSEKGNYTWIMANSNRPILSKEKSRSLIPHIT